MRGPYRLGLGLVAKWSVATALLTLGCGSDVAPQDGSGGGRAPGGSGGAFAGHRGSGGHTPGTGGTGESAGKTSNGGAEQAGEPSNGGEEDAGGNAVGGSTSDTAGTTSAGSTSGHAGTNASGGQTDTRADGGAGTTSGGAGTTSGGVSGTTSGGVSGTTSGGGGTSGQSGAAGQSGASGAGGFGGVGGTPAGGNGGSAGTGLTSAGGIGGNAGTAGVTTPRLSAESCNGIDDDGDGRIDNLGTFTCGLGACERTVTACVGGELQHCVAGTPASGPDGCDGIDNDCDGAVDEDCGACFHVAPDGDDAAAAASDGATAFASVQAAIDFADGHRDIATQVCVAAGPACGLTTTFDGPADADLRMADGIDVFGDYESTHFTRCTDSVTHLAPATARGVVFGPEITHDTTLDGFIVDRGTFTSVAGVTVDGARGARVANVVIAGALGWSNASFGVDVMNGADALVTRSRIDNGTTAFGAAVRSTGARVDVEDNCPAGFDANGRCVATCSTSGAELDSRYVGPPIQGSRIVELDDAPGSRVERNGLCSQALVNDAPGILVTGDATGVLIRGNDVQTTSRTENNSFSLRLEDCGGASPWVVDNPELSMDFLYAGGTGGDVPSATVRAAGDCHPVIESNDDISALGDSETTRAIHCDEVNGVASRCVITHNLDVRNPADSTPLPSGQTASSSELVRCDGGSCARIDHNRVLGTDIICTSARCARSVTALVLAPGGATFVSSNYLTAGGSINVAGTGVSALGAGARLENNVIIGATSNPGYNHDTSGFASLGGFGLVGYADVDSNYIAGSPLGGAVTGTCESYGVYLTGVGGTFRNNVISAGGCGASILRENPANHPDVFERNTLYNGNVVAAAPGQALGALFDDSTSGLFNHTSDQLVFTVPGVEAFTTLNVTSILDANCAVTSDFHLPAGSPCIDAGSVIGAPLVDMDGDARSDGKPDIGADEVAD